MSTVNVAEGRALLAKATAGPWEWGIHDYSMASLEGPRGEYDHVLSLGPCEACAMRVCEKDGHNASWEWGRCTTPSQPNASLIVWLRNNADALLDAAERKESRVAPLLEALSVAIGAFNDMRHGRSARLSNDAMWRLLCAARDAYTTVQSSEP